MDPVTTVLILMLAVAVFALLASKIGVPYPTVMVVGGLVICFIPSLHKVTITPDLVFTLFLPPLLYGAAWQMSWKDFWTNRRSMLFLGLGLVLFTTAGVAWVAMTFIPGGFTWAAAFALGAINSPPDAIAVTALTKKVRLPRRVVQLLDSESLINDASALVTLNFAVAAAVTGRFSPSLAVLQFFLVAGGGIAIGIVMGWLVSQVHRRLRDPLIETTLTFLTPYAVYLLTDQLNLSAVLATVAAGLYVSWQLPHIMAPQERVTANVVWEFVLFMLNGFVFVLVGLGLPSVLRELPDVRDAQLVGYGCLLVGAMIVLRIVWIVAGTYLFWTFTQFTRKPEPRPSFRQTLLLGWTGMRGVVSLAAALALPLNIQSGAEFPARQMIIFLSFFVILVTLVMQSLTLPAVVKLLGVFTHEDEAGEEREARLVAARAALTFLKDLTDSTDAFGDVGIELRGQYERRIERLETGPIAMPLSAVGIDTSVFDLHREALSAERQAIVELRATQKISTELFQRLMADVDTEELRIGRVT